MASLTLVICLYVCLAFRSSSAKNVTADTGIENTSSGKLARGTATTAASTVLTHNDIELECKFDTDVSLITSNQDAQQKCCSNIMYYYRKTWFFAVVNLSDLLRALSLWECPQLEEQCSKPWFAFSEFNKLTYKRFCNSSEYFTKCSAELSAALGQEQYQTLLTNDTSDSRSLSRSVNRSSSDVKRTRDPNTVVHHLLRATNLTMAQTLQPCIQAGLIDPQNRSSGRFYEMKEVQNPMCGILWQGFMEDFYRSHKVTEWILMSKTCKGNVIAVMVVCTLLSIAIFATNAIAILVFALNPKLRDSQGVYKMSLAVSDLLVGLIVFPTMIESMRRAYISEYKLVSTEYNHFENDQDGVSLRIYSFTEGYRGFVGFFTVLSLSVSVYTLAIASFDRFMVVFRPLRYDTHKAKAMALKLVTFIWILSIVFAITPFPSTELKYDFFASVLIAFAISADPVPVFFIYFAAFVIPLLTLWTVNIATYIYSKKNAKVRPKIRKPDSTVESVNIEYQLFRTLSIMVGVFSASIFPILIVLLVQMVIPGIRPFHPGSIIPHRLTTMSSVELVAAIILMTNSLWNFFIYNSRSKEFRRSCKKLFGRIQIKIHSNVFRDSAKEARKRRTSAALSYNISPMPSTNISSIN